MKTTKKQRGEAEDGAYYNRVHSETQWKGCEKRGEKRVVMNTETAGLRQGKKKGSFFV